MEGLCRQSHISIDTVKPAYHRLHQEGYISLSQKAGAKVAVNYGAVETGHHVLHYFSQRKDALFDLCQSMWPLFGRALRLSLRHATPETTDQMEQMTLGTGQPLAASGTAVRPAGQ